MRTTLPLFPTDDGWPYPDVFGHEPTADTPDFDALELLGPRAYTMLSERERAALFAHFGLDGRPPVPMKQLAPMFGCTRTEARELVGGAIDKVRVQLLTE